MSAIGNACITVGTEHLAPTMKTGSVNVLSTAIMAALMEEAACNAIDVASVSNGQASVGVNLELTHRRPSAIGANVKAIARLTDINKKGIHFEIEAFDDTGLIGTAKHRRVFVNKDEFESKCYETARKARK